ncbi:GpE family phage tail protein [Alteromonas sp. a30]|nr:GpE family phage tail protein [Alteromonas sp. a30]MCY7295092.1 GpE family phage tail protein [Alteromonas sp. a30]
MEAWGDIAAIFHWPPSEMTTMTLPDLATWYTIAIERHNKMYGQAHK